MALSDVPPGAPTLCKNSAYSMSLAAVARGSKSFGYKKQHDVFDVDNILQQTSDKEEKFAFVGDLLSDMRKRKKKLDSHESSKKAVVTPPQPPTPPPPCPASS